jgi:hypothetical protein
MPKKIIATSSFHSLGATFLDWSIVFLSGRNEFYHQKSNRLIDLVKNPLTNLTGDSNENIINAHGHKKNHPSGLVECKNMINSFLETDYDFFTLYPLPLHFDLAAKDLKIELSELSQHDNLYNTNQHIIQDYKNLVEYLLEEDCQFIFLSGNKETSTYLLDSREIDRSFLYTGKLESVEERDSEFQNLFFPDSKKTWQSLKLTNLWDKREQLALDTRPLENYFSDSELQLSQTHHYINCQEWWNMGVETIKQVMDFCEVKINTTRLTNWVPVYYQWQKIQHEKLKFCYQLPHIVDSIINGWYYQIDLSFNQEVAVQHCLIYNHGLNLKTWQLNKFPDNTQKLHELLEPNIHPL